MEAGTERGLKSWGKRSLVAWNRDSTPAWEMALALHHLQSLFGLIFFAGTLSGRFRKTGFKKAVGRYWDKAAWAVAVVSCLRGRGPSTQSRPNVVVKHKLPLAFAQDDGL